MRLKLAKDRSFTDIAEADILDAEDVMEFPTDGGVRPVVDYVGSHPANYDSCLVFRHFKGRSTGGFGGAIKNMSIGFTFPRGKRWIHSGGTSYTIIRGGE